jgi:hypothetical protein
MNDDSVDIITINFIGLFNVGKSDMLDTLWIQTNILCEFWCVRSQCTVFCQASISLTYRPFSEQSQSAILCTFLQRENY